MKFFLILTLIFLSLNLFAGENKTMTLKHLSTPAHIDGVIDDVWNNADSSSDFYQLQPFAGKASSLKSTAKIFTTDQSIYCMLICYDDKTNIQQNTGKLDDFGGDIVSLMLDTFGDKRTAYKFAVTAAGVRADCRLLDDARNRDYSWDGVWFADAKVYEDKFVVEIEVPYRTIQYNENLTEWGLDFDRWIPWKNEDTYWCDYQENEGQRISKFGTLVFQDFRPSVKGLNLEIYPVGIAKATYLHGSDYKVEPDAGIDIFYNPSQKLTFQLTGNPDFAQIEADPFNFNISRYESHFDERRPFFTEGSEVFTASGRDRNSGFYKPLELLYTRRIGKKLPDGSEIPLQVGTKAFGRSDDWEYGGFMAFTGEQDYTVNGTTATEPDAMFASARLKKQILDNSSVGLLFVNKHANGNDDGVIDIDGVFRSTEWQLSYQVAQSVGNKTNGLAASAGFTMFTSNWMTLVRVRHIGENFNINQVGYVPWVGTTNSVGLTGPRWYFETGDLKQIQLWGGYTLYDERVDNFTDYGASIGGNMQFRSNWGFEIDADISKSKDLGIEYTSYDILPSIWFTPSPIWSGNVWGGYQKTYNFSRNYLAFYSWAGIDFSLKATDILNFGVSVNANIEGNPDNEIEDITYNARPYFSLTPINDLNMRLYVDETYVNSQEHVTGQIVGFLFAYSFLPKSWIYFAFNDFSDRSLQYDGMGMQLPQQMHVVNRAGVLKIKYLYYL